MDSANEIAALDYLCPDCAHRLSGSCSAIGFVRALHAEGSQCCAGTLITAPLNRKYLLTADHCFVDKKAINNFEYW